MSSDLLLCFRLHQVSSLCDRGGLAVGFAVAGDAGVETARFSSGRGHCWVSAVPSVSVGTLAVNNGSTGRLSSPKPVS